MKAVTLKEIKTELSHCSHNEIMDLCLHLSKFKKENKELLTYLLFESSNEEGYVNRIKLEMEEQFCLIQTKNYYFVKKSVRKILKTVKTYIRYSKNKETEVELLLHFCNILVKLNPTIENNIVLKNLYHREIESIKKKITFLHEDLQHDFLLEIELMSR